MHDISKPDVSLIKIINNKLNTPVNCEIDLSETCLLRCGYCAHCTHYFTDKDPIYSYENFAKDIGILKDVIHFDTLHAMGGEPLLNKDLAKYLKLTKESKICNFLNIITNGILIRETDDEVFNTLDGMSVSIYPSTSEETQQRVRDSVEYLKKNFPKLLITVHSTPWFFKMCSIEKNKDPQLVRKIYENCYRAQMKDFSMFNGKIYRCFMSRKQYNYLSHHKHMIKDDIEYLKADTHDSVEIKEGITAEELNVFLSQDEPLESCKWCLGCSGKRHAHSQIKDGDIDYATLADLDFEGAAKFLKFYIHRRCELENTRFMKDLGRC